MSGFPTCAWWLIAPVVLLSPVLAFLAALAVEIFVGVLEESSMPALLTLLAGAGFARLIFRRLWVRRRSSALVVGQA
jgi:hypothetical protein